MAHRSERDALDALGAAIAALERIPNPRERAVAIRAVADGLGQADARLRRLLAVAIQQIREEPTHPSWREIGELLGLTGQRVEQLARTTEPTTGGHR